MEVTRNPKDDEGIFFTFKIFLPQWSEDGQIFFLVCLYIDEKRFKQDKIVLPCYN